MDRPDRARPSDVPAALLAVRALSAALAVLFLLTGAAKIVGFGPDGMRAAAMLEFPPWVRMMVGALEIAGAIALLVPATSTVAALTLAGLMLPATAIQYMSGEGLTWVPPLVGLALVAVAWLRNRAHVTGEVARFTDRPHPLLRDAAVSGAIGATTIALWFLVVDAIAGRPFWTPTVLGRGLFSLFGPIGANEGAATFVMAYTAFHFAAFFLVGFIAAAVVHAARREPSILIGFVMLFAATEVGIYTLVALLDVGTPLGRWAWVQIMAANLLAAAAMGWYYWRTHRELGDEWKHSLDARPYTYEEGDLVRR